MFGKFKKNKKESSESSVVPEEDEPSSFSSIAPRVIKTRESSIIGKKETTLHEYAKHTTRSGALATNLDRERANISFSQKERQAHTHIIGSTGTGKSKVMELLLRQDILNRKAGFCLLDPHGSLYEEILLYASHYHPHLAERFVLFNPAEDMGCITGFNPIPKNAENMDYVIQSLVSACLKAWGQDNTATTPRISRWLENIFYTVISNDLTLIESSPLMGIYNKAQREKLLKNVHNEIVLDDWRMFETSSPIQKQNLIEGAANRLRRFIGNSAIRDVIGCNSHSLDFTKVMEEGKIVLINLNGKTKIPAESCNLLGIMMVNEIFRCAKCRDSRNPALKPFYVYIDEFAQFVTQDIARTLEEARKFKVFMILAHQHLAQLKDEDEYLYASVMTNCKNKIVFGGLSREDAELMNDEISTGFVDLKSIKDQILVTKQRSRLELRKVKNSSQTNSGGTNWSKGSSVMNGSNSQSSTNRGYNTGNQTSSGSGKTFDKNGSRLGGSESTSSNSSRGESGGSSQGRGTSHSETEQNSHGGNESWSKSEGISETWVNNPEEYMEVSSRTFWTKDELMYLEMAEMKNQGVAHAFIKCGSNPPYKARVNFVQPVVYNPRSSPARIQKFMGISQKSNDIYCVMNQISKEESRERQKRFFGEAICFDQSEAEEAVEQEEVSKVEEAEDNPFT